MGIFDSNANTNFNAFGNINESWGAQGGFNMNSAYASPAYMAPYRPPYQGGHVANQNPGFFRSMYGVSPFNFQGAPYGVDTGQQDSSYWDSLSHKPMDFGASGFQRVGVPLLAFGGATAFTSAFRSNVNPGMVNAGLRGWNEMWSRPAQAPMSRFTLAGANFTGGAARGMIGGMFGASAFAGEGLGAMAARGAVGAAGMVGGAAMAFGVPLALGQAGISAFNSFVGDNYIGLRENQNVMRSAFSGTTLGGGMGDLYSGQGISRGASARMGSSMAQFGAKDQLFNSREMASMTSMSAQMGLLDNVSGEELTRKMKTIITQVKAVMSIAGTTEFKEAINIMARLQMAGVSSGNLSGVFSGMGSLSAQAGISTGRMMNTVGAQGQYLFQANGLTPYLGQITAANSMAGFSSAFRTGLISPDLMARMGGVEGATQSSLTGQLNAAQTTYNMMRGFNRYSTGRGGSGVVENISNFGNTFAGNPFEAYGELKLSGRANISRLMRDEGPLATYRQARELADINPQVGRGRAFTRGSLMATLGQMGMDDQQATAYMSELGSYQDDRSMGLRKAGARSNRINREQDYLAQTEQTFAMTLPGVQEFMYAQRGIRSGIARGLGNLVGGSGNIMDVLSMKMSNLNYGKANSLAGGTAEDLANQPAIPSLSARADTENKGWGAPTRNAANASYNAKLREHRGDIQALIRAAESGDAVANRALRGDKDAIQKMSDRGVIAPKYANSSDADSMAQTLMSLPKEEGDRLGQRVGQLSEDLKGGIFSKMSSGKIGGSGDKLDEASTLQKYYQAGQLFKGLQDNGDLLERSPEALAKAKGLFGDLGIRELEQKITQATAEAGDYGLDISRDMGGRKEGESNRDFALRTKMNFGMRTENRSINAPAAARANRALGRGEENRLETQRNETREALMGMGRIDLVAAYDMSNAAAKWDKVADKFDATMNKVLGTQVSPQDLSSVTAGPITQMYRDVANVITGKIRR